MQHMEILQSFLPNLLNTSVALEVPTDNVNLSILLTYQEIVTEVVIVTVTARM
jgi:hypothetical protein